MKSKWNTAIVTLVFAVMLIFVGGGRIDAQAATNVSWGYTYSGTMTSSNDEFTYRLSLPSAGRVRLTMTLSNLKKVKIYIENISGTQVWGSEYPVDGTTNYDIDLTAGTYTLYVEQWSGTGDFSFTSSFTSAGESFAETNNTRTNASRPSFGREVNGHLAYNDEIDIYRYDLTSSGRITFTLNSTLESAKLYVEDASGERIWGIKYPKEGTTTYTIDLVKGTYYINVERYGKSDNYTGTYHYMAVFTSAGETFSEPNNSPTEAAIPTLGTAVKGQLAANDKTDVYRYTFSSARKLTLQFNSSLEEVVIYLTDASGKRVWGRKYPKAGSTRYDIDVNSGTYYFYVERTGSNDSGTYIFTLGNYIAPQQTGNKPGSAGQSTASKPKKTQISRIVSKGGRKIVVTWKAKSGVSGYQIQCALKKNFKKGVKTYTIKGKKKTSKTIKKLKAKKKYFVRVRSFTKTKVNGKTKKIYSKWSKVKKVKVKR